MLRCSNERKNRKRYSENTTYNKNRAWIISAATSNTFGFDCIGLIKGVLWGFDGNVERTYGGAVYKSNDVPDVNADTTITLCKDVSSNFEKIVPGECVWMQGHIGVYVGNGVVIECTPKWNNCVQYSNLANIGYKDGHSRTWTKHGKLPWVDYGVGTSEVKKEETKPVEVKTDSNVYIVAKGDTLSKIGKKFNLNWKNIAKLNGIKFPYIIRVGQKLKLK